MDYSIKEKGRNHEINLLQPLRCFRDISITDEVMSVESYGEISDESLFTYSL